MDNDFRRPSIANTPTERHSISERRGMLQDYDVGDQLELEDLTQNSDEGEEGGRKRTSFDVEDSDHPSPNGQVAKETKDRR